VSFPSVYIPKNGQLLTGLTDSFTGIKRISPLLSSLYSEEMRRNKGSGNVLVCKAILVIDIHSPAANRWRFSQTRYKNYGLQKISLTGHGRAYFFVFFMT